jgi:peptide/nickel transport system permease protein
MGGFLLRKAGAALIVVFCASVVVFVGVRALPGDPALALGGENRDPAVMAAIRHDYGLDRPLPIQYVKWVSRALRGDLGLDSRQLPVGHTIIGRIPITLELAVLAVLIGTVIGIIAGVLAAVRRGKIEDHAATTTSLVGLSVPHFWLGLMMIIVFAVDLHWLPASGYVSLRQHPLSNLEHLLMPALVLGTGLSAVLMRQTRSAMLSSLGADYVRTARAKGLPEW